MIDQSIEDKIVKNVAGNSKGKGWGKGPSFKNEDYEYKAKVKGFPAGTLKDEIEAAMTLIIKDAEAAGIKKTYCPAFRANKGFVLFDNPDGYKSFMKRTRDQVYTVKVDDGQLDVTVVPYQSQEQWEETKETRTLVRTIDRRVGWHCAHRGELEDAFRQPCS